RHGVPGAPLIEEIDSAQSCGSIITSEPWGWAMAKFKLHARNSTEITLLASTISAILSGGAAHRAGAQEAGTVEEVVVTGSRIVRRDFEASTPIMTVDAER